MPLLLLVLLYNIKGQEAEQGFLPLVFVQTGAKNWWLFSRTAFYTILVLLTLFGLLFYGAMLTPIFKTDSTFWQFFLWIGIYLIFWILIYFLILKYGKNTVSNTLQMIGFWLLFAFIIPAAVQQWISIEKPTNLMVDILGLGIIILSYPFFYERLKVIELEESVLLYFIAFVCVDFASYCHHRLKHSINIFWNMHVIHHSSEEFNLACALRQSITNNLGIGILFLIPAALLGVPHQMIIILGPLHLFGQFWYHTRHIGKLGWLEYILVTPSQHRVHHAINK